MSEFPKVEARDAVRGLMLFQRRTVDYVFRRLYTDKDSTRRFLVADETGLGKTMVARGVIVKALEHLWSEVPRIDVIYICSHRAIAEQNLGRLNVLGQQATAVPTRMTLLLFKLEQLAGKKVNLVSLTPGTTFNLRSATGIIDERALLFALLRELQVDSDGLRNLLQVRVGRERWISWADRASRRVARLKKSDEIGRLVKRFLGKVESDEGNPRQEDPSMATELDSLCNEFKDYRTNYSWELRSRRNALIGRLRGLLARLSIDMLEPDLIILDEFQRFMNLLRGESDAAILAKELFEYQDQDNNDARTLLLSATPYRMLTLSSDREEEGDHYEDLLETLTFLYGPERGPKVAEEVRQEIQAFRKSLFSLPGAKEQAVDHKSRIERHLRKVVARTERVGSTAERDAMVAEPHVPVIVKPEDLRQAIANYKVFGSVGRRTTVEYWKSAPYLLNFMREYSEKRALREERWATDSSLVEAVQAARRTCLDKASIDDYHMLPPSNGRMRAIMADVTDTGLDRHLWIPPSLPYYKDDQPDVHGLSKVLVFSQWRMVPDAVAAILSYESERRMGTRQADMRYFDAHHSRPLQFKLANDKPASLRVLLLTCPSPVIADLADPLQVVASHAEIPSYDQMRAALADRLRPQLSKLRKTAGASGSVTTWEWAGPAVLDSLNEDSTSTWLESNGPFDAPVSTTQAGARENYRRHVVALRKVARSNSVSGQEPAGFLDLLVDLALGSPAICALRALHRVVPELKSDDTNLLTAASRIAWGFLSLFNHHETVALLKGESEDKYWHSVITHCARKNLQSVLDEFVHYLAETKGLTEENTPELRVKVLAKEIHDVLALRPSLINVDEPVANNGQVEFKQFKMRGRFAMRLADYSDEDGAVARLSGVHDAFNSPFRPFVLATTSIGQEGLDFHPYCRIVYHWNLPYNPVDLEQREGRVNRYKCHAIRLNVAEKHSSAVQGCGTAPQDPWDAMFADASSKVPDSGGLIPFWVYEGRAKIERRVPMLPHSREVRRLDWLKKSLAAYRLAFGQPRQDDLVAYLQGLVGKLEETDLLQLQIRLEPAGD